MPADRHLRLPDIRQAHVVRDERNHSKLNQRRKIAVDFRASHRCSSPATCVWLSTRIFRTDRLDSGCLGDIDFSGCGFVGFDQATQVKAWADLIICRGHMRMIEAPAGKTISLIITNSASIL